VPDARPRAQPGTGETATMSKFFRFIGREVREILPATIFFLILFHLVSMTKSLILSEHSIPLSHSATATVLALVVAKVILIADTLPMMKSFADKPLIYPTLWRTFVYSFLVAIVQYLEELIPAWIDTGNFATANARVYHELVWTQFLGVHIWLVFGLFVYCAATEVIARIGAKEFRSLFFTGGGNSADL
jgi:hypothetical protein